MSCDCCSRVFESVHFIANRVELRDRLIATPFCVARSLYEVVCRTHVLAPLHDSFLIYLKDHAMGLYIWPVSLHMGGIPSMHSTRNGSSFLYALVLTKNDFTKSAGHDFWKKQDQASSHVALKSNTIFTSNFPSLSLTDFAGGFQQSKRIPLKLGKLCMNVWRTRQLGGRFTDHDRRSAFQHNVTVPKSYVRQNCEDSEKVKLPGCEWNWPRVTAITSILLRLTRVSVCLCVCVYVCLCAKFDQFLPVRSHFDPKRPVNVFHIATFQSASFGRPLFAFVLCVLRQKNH